MPRHRMRRPRMMQGDDRGGWVAIIAAAMLVGIVLCVLGVAYVTVGGE